MSRLGDIARENSVIMKDGITYHINAPKEEAEQLVETLATADEAIDKTRQIIGRETPVNIITNDMITKINEGSKAFTEYNINLAGLFNTISNNPIKESYFPKPDPVIITDIKDISDKYSGLTKLQGKFYDDVEKANGKVTEFNKTMNNSLTDINKNIGIVDTSTNALATAVSTMPALIIDTSATENKLIYLLSLAMAIKTLMGGDGGTDANTDNTENEAPVMDQMTPELASGTNYMRGMKTTAKTNNNNETPIYIDLGGVNINGITDPVKLSRTIVTPLVKEINRLKLIKGVKL
jgi:hypothetical protein